MRYLIFLQNSYAVAQHALLFGLVLFTFKNPAFERPIFLAVRTEHFPVICEEVISFDLIQFSVYSEIRMIRIPASIAFILELDVWRVFDFNPVIFAVRVNVKLPLRIER